MNALAPATAEEWVACFLMIYMAGAVITVLSSQDDTAIDRRMWLWPLYWLYLAADFVRELVRARQ